MGSLNTIAVVEIDGVIMQGKNKHDVIFGEVSTGADQIVRIFKELAKDPFVRGVVVRINSPGGSMIASDQILNAIYEYKQKTGRPVYTSMGTYAASGGYLIAMATDQIFANPVTITGSIGVFTGFFPNFYELEQDWDVSSTSFSTSKYMDSFSPHQEFSTDKQLMLAKHIHASYAYFKDRVQSSRMLTDDEVSALSQGQIMSGQQAKSVGLIDDIGNYSDTIAALETKLD